ncbi:efflux RND transporter periplasmic adaptor subunit [Vibrio fluvialis]|nr:efflux RND transporter periplasmic adaptor subunit [Vibrio fluvialis]
MKKTILFSVTLAATFFYPVAFAAGAAKAIPVVIESVQTHQVSQTLSLVGKLKAEQSVNISPEVTGKVDTIAVRANQQVKKGQLLVQLNDDKSRAAVNEANAYLRDEQRKLTEFERLVKRNAITQTEIDAQKASVEIAQARLDAAKANLDDLRITAPFDGTVGFIDFSRGKMVSAGNELLTLDNLSLMQLDLQVPERYLSKIKRGMKVLGETNAWPGQVFEGRVVGIDSRINQETLNLRVRIHFNNKERLLKPGMLISAKLDFEPISAPIIPVQALEYSGTKRFVYVVGDNHKATRTEVHLGARIENEVVIEDGLNIGQQIVVQGIVNMRDGATVTEVDTSGQPLEKGEQ